jgi:hypothetical protein
MEGAASRDFFMSDPDTITAVLERAPPLFIFYPESNVSD